MLPRKLAASRRRLEAFPGNFLGRERKEKEQGREGNERKGKERKCEDRKRTERKGNFTGNSFPLLPAHILPSYTIIHPPPRIKYPYNIQMAIHTMRNLIIWMLYKVFNFRGWLYAAGI